VVGLYFGRRWEIAYTICVVLFIFSGLWAYATVFANSMMVFVPFPSLSAGYKATSTNSTLATVSRSALLPRSFACLHAAFVGVIMMVY
jgi:hypothetical protein